MRGVPFFLHYLDMTDSTNFIRLVRQIKPTEIYNLAAQSHVGVSFESPEYTADADAIGVLRLSEAIRILGMEKETRFYQASTSELYGLVQEVPQTETTPFYPRSPYGVAKLYGYWITVICREAYGEVCLERYSIQPREPTRGETFVMRKITRGIAQSGSRRQHFPNSSRKWLSAILRSRYDRSPMASIPFELKGKTVFVACHRGMVRSALVRRLAQENVELLRASRCELDLRDQAAVNRWFSVNPRCRALRMSRSGHRDTAARISLCR